MLKNTSYVISCNGMQIYNDLKIKNLTYKNLNMYRHTHLVLCQKCINKIFYIIKSSSKNSVHISPIYIYN